MKKLIYILAVIGLCQFGTEMALSHVLHYQNLKKLEFDLYRNNKFIGKHIYSFSKKDNKMLVESEIYFKIKKLGVVLYRYKAQGKEEYIDGKFSKFSATTNQNKKEKFCEIFKKENDFFIEGSSFKGKAPDSFIIGTWWNHEIINYDRQISAVSGRIIEQKVDFLGKEDLSINGKNYKALKFNFSSTDKSLSKDKKLNVNIWYDEETLIWLKSSFDKKGKWEYRLKNVER